LFSKVTKEYNSKELQYGTETSTVGQSDFENRDHHFQRGDFIMNLSNSEGRRDSLKIAAAGTAVIALDPEFGNVIGAPSSEPAARDPGNKSPGRVALNFNQNLAKNDTINTAVIAKMVDQTIARGCPDHIAISDSTV
jgi:hypothetical protein